MNKKNLLKISCLSCLFPAAQILNSVPNLQIVCENNSKSDETAKKPDALFASPIFSLSENNDGFSISGSSNKILESKTNFTNSLLDGGTRYLSVDSIHLSSIESVTNFIPYFGYGASEAKNVTNLLKANKNKMSLAELMKHKGVITEAPYLSFLEKIQNSKRGLAKLKISGQVTINCENASLFDPFFTQTFNFNDEIEMSNFSIIGSNINIPIFLKDIPNDLGYGSLNMISSDNSFNLENIFLNYVVAKDDIPTHYELSYENGKGITFDKANLDLSKNLSNDIVFDKKIIMGTVPSSDFEYPNFYKIKLDTQDINWREIINDETGKKIKYPKVYDIFTDDSYEPIDIPINRFTFLGFNGKKLNDKDVQFWLSQTKNPDKTNNLLFYPQDEFGSSDISYLKNDKGNVSDVVVKWSKDRIANYCDINWVFSCAGGYSTSYIPIETNDEYDFSNTPFVNKIQGLFLIGSSNGSSGLDPFGLRINYCGAKYSLNLKPDSEQPITGKSRIYSKWMGDKVAYDHDIDVDYTINIKNINFEIPQFNLDLVRRYFEIHPEDVTKIFSLNDIINFTDMFNIMGYTPSINIKFDGLVHLVGYNIWSRPDRPELLFDQTFDLNNLPISTIDPLNSCSFKQEYSSNYSFTPSFSINDYVSGSKTYDTIYELLSFKFERNSSNDFVPKFFESNISHNVRIAFNINDNTSDAGIFASTLLSPFSFANEKVTYIGDVFTKPL